MWFGLKQLLWQCVFLLDEEIIVYGPARVLFICILRSSPAPRSLSVRLNYAVGEIPPHQTQSGFILFSAAWREFFFFFLTSNSHTGEIFWLRSIITARMKGSHRAALLTATIIICSVFPELSYWDMLLRSKPVTRDQTVCTCVLCVCVCVCVCVWRRRGQTQGREDYRAALDNTQVADLGA